MRRTSSLKLSRRVRLSAGGGGGGGGSGTVVSAHPATRLERCLRSVFLGLSQGRLTCHGAARHQGVLNAGMARSPSKSCCDAPCWQAGCARSRVSMTGATAPRVPTIVAALGAADSAAEAAANAGASADASVDGSSRALQLDHWELDVADDWPTAAGSAHRGHASSKRARRFHELDSEEGDAATTSSNGTATRAARWQSSCRTPAIGCFVGRPYAAIGCLVFIPFACSAVVLVVAKFLFVREHALPELGAGHIVERSRTTWTMPLAPPLPPLLPQPPVPSMPPPSLPSPPSPLQLPLPAEHIDPLPPAWWNIRSPPPSHPPPRSPPPLSPPPQLEEVCRAEHCTDANNDCCAPPSIGERATCAEGYTPKRVGGCGGFDRGQFVCCGPPGPTLDPHLARLQRAFAADGLLVHTVPWSRSGDWTMKLHDATSPDELQLAEADCGEHCVALSLLHARLPVQLFCPECAPPARAVGIKYIVLVCTMHIPPCKSMPIYQPHTNAHSCISVAWRSSSTPARCGISTCSARPSRTPTPATVRAARALSRSTVTLMTCLERTAAIAPPRAPTAQLTPCASSWQRGAGTTYAT